MTKELKQEAEECWKSWFDNGGKEDIPELLFKFAEPREKRIAELEAQIEKMKCCKNCIYQGECDLSGYEECKNFDKWEIKEK